MSRKAILEGGKRDEIIAVATKLFFTEGFEATSVRKILALVDGEIGMFYHYFASKEELFEQVVWQGISGRLKSWSMCFFRPLMLQWKTTGVLKTICTGPYNPLCMSALSSP